MKFSTLAVALTAALASTVSIAATSKPQASSSSRYLVVFNSDTLPADAAARISNAGGKMLRGFGQVGVATVSGDAKFLAAITKDSKVLSVGPEHLFAAPKTTLGNTIPENVSHADAGPTAADNLLAYQWDMRRIGADQTWARVPFTTNTPRVAVLDVGTMDSHPDLDGQIDNSISTAYCSTSGGPNNTDGFPIYTTFIDFDAFPNWSPSDGCSPMDTVYEWHGTHTAGTVAAKFGGGRVVGVAPDAKVGVYKVFDHYRFTDPTDGLVDGVGAFDTPLFVAIIDATLRGYPVISMSLGGSGVRNDKVSNASWLAWNRVANWATKNGALLVAAAGNEGLDLNGVTFNTPSDVPSVMNVSASSSNNLVVSGGQLVAAAYSDVLAFYSNYGSPVDITAPGGDCGPVFPNDCDFNYFVLNDYIFEDGSPGYVWSIGTSMATPHVAGVAAYVRALHPQWSVNQVRAFLKQTAMNIGSRQAYGAGLLDENAATQ